MCPGISLKFYLQKDSLHWFNFYISIVGIALGVATLIIAICVLKGFEQTITNKIIDFDSHIKITSYRPTIPDYQQSLPWLKTQLAAFNPDITPFASKLVIVSYKKKKDGINLIGIEPKQKPFLVKEHYRRRI
jgi:lipoprotein-releasing system permease protein